jgi:6-phosphofructokinase 1
MTNENNGSQRLGILVGGGPAPGINSVISAITIEARNSNLEVIGIYDGFARLIEGDTTAVRQLTIPDVSNVHFQGGSILRTSRANPTRNKEDLQRVVQGLKELGISYLVTIGGDDTAFSASEVSQASAGAIRVVHVPKTIDNDLPLPSNRPTFGYETARHVGTGLVLNLMEDSRTTNRWYFIVAMGRSAGHLALGMGKAAGATLTIIPEEFLEDRITLGQVCDVLECAILKRRVMGRERGLVIIAEGIAEKLDPEELAGLPGVEVNYDQHGHIRLDDIPLEKVLKREILHRFKERGEAIGIVDRTIGYELRSASPIPFDVDYTRTLGHGAVRALLSATEEGKSTDSGLVCLENGRTKIVPFEELRDPVTQRTKVRRVDIDSESYQVARDYMIRLEKEDLADPEMKLQLATAAKMTPDEFEARFAHVVELAGTVD